MKKVSFTFRRHSIATLFLITTVAVLFTACKKDDLPDNNSDLPSSYSSEVLDKWLTLQVRLMRNATGVSNHGLSRHYAYAGITAMESIAPGLPSHGVWNTKWNGLTGLPVAAGGEKFYYPANLNAALAAINKAMFPAASSADAAAIDSLEFAISQGFAGAESQEVLTKSVAFGKAVATAVFNWAETDGYKNANNPYTIPTGFGLWKPTPPALANPATPYWGNNRTVIAGSIDGASVAQPIAYSTDPHSGFYQMVKQVYDVSQSLSDDQKSMATFWRDVPGATTPGHWVSIVQQIIRKTGAAMDKGVLAYALSGAAMSDAAIACFKNKYQYNVVRPITYIREVMGYSTWNSHIGTPAHPEYPSAHSTLSTATAEVLQGLFGNIGSITDHTYDYLGFAPRSFSSISAIGTEASQSRLYAGIHYQKTIDLSIAQGKKVAVTIFGAALGN